jgi:nitric oxide reductase subunit B
MLAIALMYTILPAINQRPVERVEKLGFTAFVCANFGMIFIVMALLIAGIVQVYLQRIMGLDFLEVQEQLRLWFEVRLAAGALFLLGTLLLIGDLYRLGWRAAPGGAVQAPRETPAG